jgi:hypothetical protein
LAFEHSHPKIKPVSLCVHPLSWLVLVAYEDGSFIYFDINEVKKKKIKNIFNYFYNYLYKIYKYLKKY